MTTRTVVLVVPVHRGAAAGLDEHLRCTLEAAASRGATVAVVSVEGAPKVVFSTSLSPTGANENTVKKNIALQITQINQAVNAARATSDGTDLLEALALAADTAAGAQVVSLDPGLNDRGLLDFTRPGLLGLDDAGMQSAAAHVQRDRSCAKFAGRSITLVGLGFGVHPQAPLSAGQRATVGKLYTTVLQACGATVHVLDAGPVQPTPVDSAFAVTPVDPGAVPSFDPTRRSSIRFDDASDFGFRSDSVQFRDPDAARRAASLLTAQLKNYPKVTLTITGTTSNGPTAWPSLESLGGARAEAVKALLKEVGMANPIEVVAKGYTANPPVVSPETAALNRAVTVSFSS